MDVLKFKLFLRSQMVDVAQLVRALDCGSRGRRFEPGLPPKSPKLLGSCGLFIFFVLLLKFIPGRSFIGVFPIILKNHVHSIGL